jgi:hypothetical protein
MERVIICGSEPEEEEDESVASRSGVADAVAAEIGALSNEG